MIFNSLALPQGEPKAHEIAPERGDATTGIESRRAGKNDVFKISI